MAVKSTEKYAAILDGAESVFARQGYHNAQISRIAAEAGVAAGTVYLYFKNKPDVLISLFRDRLTRMIGATRAALATAGSPAAKLRLFIRLHLRALAERRDLAVVTQIEMRQADADVQQEISRIMKGYFALIDEIVHEGQAEGTFARLVDPRQIRNMIFGTLDQTVTAWVLSGGRFDLEALSEPTFLLLTSGISSREREARADGH